MGQSRGTASVDTLRRLVLDLLSDTRPVTPDRVATLGEGDWARMLAMVTQHRLGAQLDWQIKQRHAALPIPAAVIAELGKARSHFSMRQLGMQYELCAAHKLLADAGIPAIALKGAFLAFHAYPDPALRPLRDLDLLVPEDRAVEAFDLLVAHGATQCNPGETRLEFALKVDAHHLPILWTPSGFGKIEVHRHIQKINGVRAAERNAMLVEALWAHAVEAPVAGTPIRFPAPTDLLLHLVMHAAYDHILNNGPLVLSDIAVLLRRHPIDWSRFWTLAEAADATRGAVLLLDLAEAHFGALPVDWSAAAANTRNALDEIRDPAALLMLQDRELGGEIWRLRDDGKSHRARQAMRRVVGRLFVSRLEMEMLYGVSARSPLIYLHYPRRWWSLLTSRLPRVLHTRRREGLREQQLIDADVAAWLRA